MINTLLPAATIGPVHYEITAAVGLVENAIHRQEHKVLTVQTDQDFNKQISMETIANSTRMVRIRKCGYRAMHS